MSALKTWASLMSATSGLGEWSGLIHPLLLANMWSRTPDTSPPFQNEPKSFKLRVGRYVRGREATRFDQKVLRPSHVFP